MDIATIFGLIMGFVFVSGAILLHGSITDFVDVPGAMVAFGGSSAAILVAFLAAPGPRRPKDGGAGGAATRWARADSL